jgi:hypothetical protein
VFMSSSLCTWIAVYTYEVTNISYLMYNLTYLVTFYAERNQSM